MFLKPGAKNANNFELVAPTGFEPVFHVRHARALSQLASRPPGLKLLAVVPLKCKPPAFQFPAGLRRLPAEARVLQRVLPLASGESRLRCRSGRGGRNLPPSPARERVRGGC